MFQELVATSGSDRNWKGMFISTVVILSILGLITLSVVIMREDEDDAPLGAKGHSTYDNPKADVA